MPRAPAASLSAMRVSFAQPEDVGAFDGSIEGMLLHMRPGRDVDGESFTITWQVSLDTHVQLKHVKALASPRFRSVPWSSVN